MANEALTHMGFDWMYFLFLFLFIRCTFDLERLQKWVSEREKKNGQPEKASKQRKLLNTIYTFAVALFI